MDMNHDFRPDPELGGGLFRPQRPASPDWVPELVAIVGIFIAVWIEFALHFLLGGHSW